MYSVIYTLYLFISNTQSLWRKENYLSLFNYSEKEKWSKILQKWNKNIKENNNFEKLWIKNTFFFFLIEIKQINGKKKIVISTKQNDKSKNKIENFE